MKTLTHRIGRFITSEDGPTAVEYAVMLALIIVASITVITGLGGSLQNTFSNISSNIPDGSNTGAST